MRKCCKGTLRDLKAAFMCKFSDYNERSCFANGSEEEKLIHKATAFHAAARMVEDLLEEQCSPGSVG
jgi:hypothetical protein